MPRIFLAALFLLSTSLTATSFKLGKSNRNLNNAYKQRLLTTILMSTSSSDHDSDDIGRRDRVFITDLVRYAIKGLSGDALESVMIPKGGPQTFPDDRRFALLKETRQDKFDENDPEWLHKENFLCAFSAPELMAGFRSRYEILDGEDGDTDGGRTQQQRRILTLHRRNSEGEDASPEPVLGPIDLALPSGRAELASFFSAESGQPLVCVTKESDQKISTFQFGNTRAGVKHNPGGDTRTVHIVNRATVRELSEKTGLSLSAMRFRPNIVIDGLEPWKEFDWVGSTLKIIPRKDDEVAPEETNISSSTSLILKVLTKTIRCEGIGIDPLNPSMEKLDIPMLLNKNYPEYGPYLGVYASLEVVGRGETEADIDKLLSVGDTLELL